jgi:hypothetical protein
VVRADEDAVVNDGRRVQDVVPPVHEAHDDGEPRRAPNDRLEGSEVRLDERGLEEEVFRRVARQG